MNETPDPANASDTRPSASEHRLWTPDATMRPDGTQAIPAAVSLLNHTVQGAHDTINRLADGAAPVAQHLDETASAAGRALHASTEQFRETRDEWSETLRSTVRRSPLACLTGALALGFVIARITR